MLALVALRSAQEIAAQAPDREIAGSYPFYTVNLSAPSTYSSELLMTASPSSTLLRLSVVVLAAACATSAPRNAPGDSADVTAADIEQHADEPIESLIQRKVPGVLVTKTPTGQIALFIRGARDMDGKPKPPMYVVNHMPMRAGRDGALPVNSYDIETIKVLKGPDAAIYGIDAADGVIVITLKKPKAPNPA